MSIYGRGSGFQARLLVGPRPVWSFSREGPGFMWPRATDGDGAKLAFVSYHGWVHRVHDMAKFQGNSRAQGPVFTSNDCGSRFWTVDRRPIERAGIFVQWFVAVV